MSTDAAHPQRHDHTHGQPDGQAAPEPAVRTVGLFAPLGWLAAGARDFRAAPGHSLLYGALFTGACLLTYALTRGLPWFTLAFLTGLLLLGPYLAAGLYLAARQREQGLPVSIRAALATLSERRTDMALYALFLALVMAAWIRFSSLLFALKLDLASPSIESYLGFVFGGGLGASGIDPAVTFYFVGIGFLLAAAVFVTSVVSVPVILDRGAGPVAAIGTSLRAVRRNWPAMLVWATLIVALTALGILTYFLALVAIFPLLGLASWHAYRALVEQPGRRTGD